MSREIENYICASEDRSHYNNETEYLQGFYYPCFYYPYIEHYDKENNEENNEKGDTY